MISHPGVPVNTYDVTGTVGKILPKAFIPNNIVCKILKDSNITPGSASF